MAKTRKARIVVDSAGNIAGAMIEPEVSPDSKAETAAVQSGVEAGPGQTIHEVDIADAVAKLDGGELLQHLASNDAIKKALSAIPTAGHSLVFTPGIEVTAAGQPAAGQSFQALLSGPTGAPTAGQG